jgi:hypothetical protein
MIIRQRKPSFGLILFGLLIVAISMLGILSRLLFQKLLTLITIRSSRKDWQNTNVPSPLFTLFRSMPEETSNRDTSSSKSSSVDENYES